MTDSQKKPQLKMINKLKCNENKLLNDMPELSTQESQQKKKRNRFKNIDWEQVLDYDNLVLNDQVYEAPWMRCTKKRKKLCTSFDKNDSTSNIQGSSFSLTGSNSKIDSISLSHSNELISPMSSLKIITTAEKNCSGGNKPNVSKQQKKSSEKDNHSSNVANKMKQGFQQCSKQNGMDNSFDEENLPKGDLKDKPISNIKQTRQKSQKERELKAQQGEDLTQQNKLITNETQFSQQKIQSKSGKSNKSNSLKANETSINTVSKAINTQDEKNKYQDNSSNTNHSSQIKESSLNLLKTQYCKKFLKKSQNDCSQEPSSEKSRKSTANQEETKKDKCINENLKVALQTRSQTKRSPTSSRLNEDALVINQSYDDSDASTRDEDHQDNHIRQPHIKDRSIKNQTQRITRAGVISNNDQLLTLKESPQTKQNKKDGENEKFGQTPEKKSKKTQNIKDGSSSKLKNEKELQQENEESQKGQQSLKGSKNKQLIGKSSTIQEAGDDNQIDKNKKQKKDNNNNNNQKKNQRANKNQFNLKLDETSNSNQNSSQIELESNSFEQAELQGQILSLNLNKQTSQASLRGGPQAELNSSVENLYEQSIPNIPNKKSQFSKNIPQNEKTYSTSSLDSEQNLEKIDEELNIEESGFENSNNNAAAIQQLQINQQEIDLDQQQVPHLYIRNQDYATKVGRSYQAVIPELGSYNNQQNHLQRLVTQQKVWGRDWIEEKQQKIIVKCTATLKQWYGNRRNEEQCIQHLMLLGFDDSKYNQFLEENQDYFYNIYNQYDAKFIKKKIKKKSLFSCK
ncbi:hypothetical protein TTHERM_00146050 (macronuclear) [Tetrahymena thermophila SB210]|uniref:Uncharacterized protein n=1 Tax=Tetrahymena thermophila (strain SB210) TaxID=312017 RepID=I7MI90_TETTS|nr:hypothetical protein TTHERM_00146050 [Tetrahymena thermophila SB210]EAR90999.2 hypothetical protein TTHERM_00146050 [Tetrahymena thermophila SB210]|eukprot:XP_001011244.2 hypothetical protein TTHERM_00146050 [Tetrahymena thermophila SB210]